MIIRNPGAHGALLAGGLAIALLGRSQADGAMLANTAPELDLPVGCTLGTTCFVQSYVDHDPGPEVRDYRCLGQTYNGHNGTDFRIPTMAEAQRTPVLAAAAGRVRGVRDGVADQQLGAVDLAGSNGMECGNGVVIDHGDGWETQYCHLAEGSVVVAAGDAVEAGQELGTVGLSGNTEFAHLHLSLRHRGQPVDPFAASGIDAGCEGEPQGLWSKDAAAQLAYTRSAVLNTGFAAGPVSMDEIEAGTIGTPAAASPALVAYARAINLKAGDVLSLQLFGPDGTLLADTATDPLDQNKAQWMLFTGRRLRQDRWPAGQYDARLAVIKADKVVLEQRFALTL